jgi:hypothetical protein
VHFGCVEVHLVEARGDAGVLVLGLDAEREDAHAVDLAAACQRPDPAERQQPPVELGQHLVEVGQRQRGADDLAGVLALGDHRPVLVSSGATQRGSAE